MGGCSLFYILNISYLAQKFNKELQKNKINSFQFDESNLSVRTVQQCTALGLGFFVFIRQEDSIQKDKNGVR